MSGTVWPHGIPALILFFVFGLATTKGVDLASLSVDSSSSLGLIFIIIPILVAVLILRKTNFLVALVVGDLLGIILLLILGYSDVASIFAADGLLASGTLSLMDVLVFMALIFVVLALTEEVGVLDSFQTFMVRHAKTPRMAETVSGCSPVFSVRSLAAVCPRSPLSAPSSATS